MFAKKSDKLASNVWPSGRIGIDNKPETQKAEKIAKIAFLPVNSTGRLP